MCACTITCAHTQTHIHSRAHIQVYDAMWGPAINQVMIATQKGSVDVVSLPHFETLWSMRGHSSTCYCFAMDGSHK
jgi:hypothetical protein